MPNKITATLSAFEKAAGAAVGSLASKNSQAEQAQLVSQTQEAQQPSQGSMEKLQPFVEQEIQLSALTSAGQQFNSVGSALYYRRQGSAPGGRISLDVAGTIRDFAPGDRLIGPFQSFLVKPSARSVNNGLAHLVVEMKKDFNYVEQPILYGAPFAAVSLLGNGQAQPPNFFTSWPFNNSPPVITDGTQTGSFKISGYSKLRITVDLDPGVAGNIQCSSIDIEPWFMEQIGGTWFANAQGTVTLSNSNGSNSLNYRYLTGTMDVYGEGYMWLQAVNAVGANVPSTISGIVEAIR